MEKYKIVECFTSVRKREYLTGVLVDDYTNDCPTYEIHDRESGEILEEFDDIKDALAFVKKGE